MTPKLGMRFLHSRVLMEDCKTPMEFAVTRIARGTVYYKAVENGQPVGNSQCCPVEEFSRWCKKIMEERFE